MRELLRTNDLVRLSFVQALLAEVGIEGMVLDANTASVEGSVSAIQRRLVVLDEDHEEATRLLIEAGELPDTAGRAGG